MSKKITKREIVIFSILSIFFILIPFLSISNSDFRNDESFKTDHSRKILSENILLLIFFFLNYFYLIPRFYFKKKYTVYILLLIVTFFIAYKIPEIIFNLDNLPLKKNVFHRPTHHRHSFNFIVISSKILMFLSLVLISLFIRQNKRYTLMKEQKQLSEIAYLKAQINPHFLFNTLNNIYALTLQKSDLASDAVLQLSKMMRYVVSHSSKDFVPLSQDLEYIKNYIKLQQLRLINSDSIDFKIEGNSDDLKISPLLLINFIENAFKYGIIDDNDHPIKIKILINHNTLNMLVKNAITEDQFLTEERSGIGLKNTKKRLSLNYLNRYELKIKEKNLNYVVKLKLLLK